MEREMLAWKVADLVESPDIAIFVFVGILRWCLVEGGPFRGGTDRVSPNPATRRERDLEPHITIRTRAHERARIPRQICRISRLGT